MRYAILGLIIIIGLTACKKEKPEVGGLDASSFLQCSQSQNLDSAAIAGKLIGSWVWAKQRCSRVGKTTLADKIIEVTFRTDSTFEVKGDTSILTSGTWKLKHEDGSNWGLDLSTSNDYLAGRILFCDNQVLFNDSYMDSCDNLFYKKVDDIDLEAFWECNDKLNLDSSAISDRLIGSWVWNKRGCFDGGTLLAYKNIKATFSTDHTFVVSENATTITSGTWKLKHVDGDSWGLDLSTSSEYLGGRILFCENQVLFNYSYLDMCDNLFDRTK